MKLNHAILTLALCGLTLTFAAPARAQVKLPALIGDNMVIQQDVPARI